MIFFSAIRKNIQNKKVALNGDIIEEVCKVNNQSRFVVF